MLRTNFSKFTPAGEIRAVILLLTGMHMLVFFRMKTGIFNKANETVKRPKKGCRQVFTLVV